MAVGIAKVVSWDFNRSEVTAALARMPTQYLRESLPRHRVSVGDVKTQLQTCM